jgi:hypothetical protein
MGISLSWSEFKAYCAEIGPRRGCPPRPPHCVFCDGARVWFNGWRRVPEVVNDLETPTRRI